MMVEWLMVVLMDDGDVNGVLMLCVMVRVIVHHNVSLLAALAFLMPNYLIRRISRNRLVNDKECEILSMNK